jgi:hypothetical protein
VHVPSAFWRYSSWAFGFLVARPFCWISLAILISLCATAVVSFCRSGPLRHPKSFYLLPFMLLAAFPLTIVIGERFAAISPATPNKMGALLLNGLELVALLFGIYCVYRAKGLRWFTAALVVAELWILLAAGFITGMSVSGDWL